MANQAAGEESRRNLKSLGLQGFEVPVTLRGSGRLVVFDYPFGSTAWGPLTEVSAFATTAVIEWQEANIDSLSQTPSDWFERLVRELGFGKGALCTWSMGSPPAIRFAATSPSSLDALLLVDPAGLGSKISKGIPLRHIKYLPSLISTLATKKSNRGYVELLWHLWISNPRVDHRPLVDAMLKLWSNRETFRVRNEAISNVINNPLFDELKQISVPTLIMTGLQSKVLGPTLAESAVRMLAEGEFVVFEASNHGPQLEEPEKFEKVVVEFLTEIRR